MSIYMYARVCVCVCARVVKRGPMRIHMNSPLGELLLLLFLLPDLSFLPMLKELPRFISLLFDRNSMYRKFWVEERWEGQGDVKRNKGEMVGGGGGEEEDEEILRNKNCLRIIFIWLLNYDYLFRCAPYCVIEETVKVFRQFEI